MRLRLLILAVILSGCAGHSIECLDAVARSGCPPDSAAGQAFEQQRRAEQTFAEIDDARCKSFGARGSPAYAQCRDSIEQERNLRK
jgi:hypothetical protein